MCDETLFKFLGREVKPYGVWLAVGILACFIVLYLFTKKKNVPTDVQDYIFFVGVAAIAIGFLFAHLFQVFYIYLETGVFNFMQGGITVMGGIFGGALSFIAVYFGMGNLFFRDARAGIYKKYFKEVLIIAPLCITIAHAFGRIGCMCAGCCYGRETTSIIGIENAGAVRVPVQLFEAGFLFILFGVLAFLYLKRCNNTLSIYLIAYSIWRFIIEFFRDDPRAGLKETKLEPSQWMSFIFLFVGIGLIVLYKIKKVPFFEKLNEEPVEEVLESVEEKE